MPNIPMAITQSLGSYGSQISHTIMLYCFMLGLMYIPRKSPSGVPFSSGPLLFEPNMGHMYFHVTSMQFVSPRL